MDWAASIAQEAYTNGVNPVTGEELHVHGEDDAATTSETCLPCRISKVRDGPRAALPRSRLGDALNAQVRCDKQVPCGRCRRRKVTCIPQTVRRRTRVSRNPHSRFRSAASGGTGASSSRPAATHHGGVSCVYFST